VISFGSWPKKNISYEEVLRGANENYNRDLWVLFQSTFQEVRSRQYSLFNWALNTKTLRLRYKNNIQSKNIKTTEITW